MKAIARIELNPIHSYTWEIVAQFARPGDAYSAAEHWQLGPDTGRIRVMSWTGKHWICTYNRPAENVRAEEKPTYGTAITAEGSAPCRAQGDTVTLTGPIWRAVPLSEIAANHGILSASHYLQKK